MRHARSVALVVATIALVVTACSGSPATTASVGPVTDPSRVEVRLTDSFQIEPAAMSVPAGRPITFVVTNTGAIEHEFYVGNDAAQAAHEAEMVSMGGMAQEEAMGISVDPGQTKELTITFDTAGALMAGCHVSGHFAAGMKATIQVTRS